MLIDPNSAKRNFAEFAQFQILGIPKKTSRTYLHCGGEFWNGDEIHLHESHDEKVQFIKIVREAMIGTFGKG